MGLQQKYVKKICFKQVNFNKHYLSYFIIGITCSEKLGKHWIKSGNRKILKGFIFFLYPRLTWLKVSEEQNIRIRLFLLFDVNFVFVLFLQDKFWCFHHFLWAFWFKRKCTLHGNIYINEKLNPFSNKKMQFLCKKEKKIII